MSREDLVLIESIPGQSIVLYYVTDAGQGLAHGGVGAVYNIANTFISLSNESTEALYMRMQELNKNLSEEHPYFVRPNPIYFEDSIDIERLETKDIIRVKQQLKEPVKRTDLLANPVDAPTTWVGHITQVAGEHGVYFVLGRVTGCPTIFSALGAFMSQPGGTLEKSGAALTVGGLEKFTHSALHKFGAKPSVVRDMFLHGTIHEGTHHLIEHISSTHSDEFQEAFSSHSPNLLVGTVPEQFLSGTATIRSWTFYPVYPGSKSMFLPDPSYDLFTRRDLREEVQSLTSVSSKEGFSSERRVLGSSSIVTPSSTFVPSQRTSPKKPDGSFLDGARLILSGGTSSGIAVGVEVGMSWAGFFTLGAGFLVGIGIIKYIGHLQRKKIKKLKSKLKKIFHRDEEIQGKCNQLNELLVNSVNLDPDSDGYNAHQQRIASLVSEIIAQCDDQIKAVKKLKEKNRDQYKKGKKEYEASLESWEELKNEMEPIRRYADIEKLPLSEMRQHADPAQYLDRMYRVALFAVRANDLAKAERVCDDALTLGENRNILILKAHLLLQSRDKADQALTIFQSLESKNPNGAEENIGLVRCFLIGDNLKDAFVTLDRLHVIDLSEEEREIVIGLEKEGWGRIIAQAIALIQAKKVDEAFSLSRQPSYRLPTSQLKLLEGIAACENKSWDDGVRLLQEAHDTDPEDGKITFFLDYAKQSLKQDSQELDELSKPMLLGVFGTPDELQLEQKQSGEGCVIG